MVKEIVVERIHKGVGQVCQIAAGGCLLISFWTSTRRDLRQEVVDNSIQGLQLFGDIVAGSQSAISKIVKGAWDFRKLKTSINPPLYRQSSNKKQRKKRRRQKRIQNERRKEAARTTWMIMSGGGQTRKSAKNRLKESRMLASAAAGANNSDRQKKKPAKCYNNYDNKEAGRSTCPQQTRRTRGNLLKLLANRIRTLEETRTTDLKKGCCIALRNLAPMLVCAAAMSLPRLGHDSASNVLHDDPGQTTTEEYMDGTFRRRPESHDPCLRGCNIHIEVESSANNKGDGPKKDGKPGGARAHKYRKTDGGRADDSNRTRAAADVALKRSLSALVQTPDDRRILLDKGGVIFTGINHCGKVAFKPISKRKDAVWTSRLLPFVEAIKEGRIAAHFSVENKLHTSSVDKLEAKIREWSEGCVKSVINTPTKESMSSNAISRSNDSLIVYSTALELETRRQTTASRESNGRATMQYCTMQGQTTALLCIYGVTSSCGSGRKKATAEQTTAELSHDRDQRRIDRKAAEHHLDVSIRQLVTEAKQSGAIVIAYTDANCVNNVDDRSSTANTDDERSNGRANLVTTLEELGLLDVWPNVHHDRKETPGYTFSPKTNKDVVVESRIDRFYICEDLVDMCGGFQNIRIGVASSSAQLSDAHKLLILRLPDKLQTTKQPGKFVINRGPRNQRFYLRQDEEGLFTTAVQQDKRIESCLKKLKESSFLKSNNNTKVAEFPEVARALNHLAISQQASKQLNKVHIAVAMRAQEKIPEHLRPTTGQLQQAQSLLIKIIASKGGTWNVQLDRKRWKDAGNDLAKILPLVGREHENSILQNRPKARYRPHQQAIISAEEKLLKGITVAWGRVESIPSPMATEAIAQTMSEFHNLCHKCEMPNSNTQASCNAFDWTNWQQSIDCNGLQTLRARLRGLQSNRMILNNTNMERPKCVSAVVGELFSKAKGNPLSGLTVIDEADDFTEWVSSDAELRKIIEAGVQYTSRSRNLGGAGQSIIVSTWMMIMTKEKVLWNDTTIHELVATKERMRELWTKKRTKLSKLCVDLDSWIKNADIVVADRKSATISVRKATEKERLTEAKKLFRRCNGAGCYEHKHETTEDYMTDTLREVRLCITFVDNNCEFLYDSMTPQQAADEKVTTKWRVLDKGPECIADIAATANGMNKKKSHKGMTPEHVCISPRLQEGLLELSRFYFCGDVPDEMKTGIITSLYKSDRKFRPITSLDISFQLCEAYWTKNEMELVIDCGTDRQYGGVTGRGANEPLLELQLLLADAVHNDKTLIAYLSDKTSAFDSARPSMCPILYKRWNCPNHISNRMASVASNHLRVCRTSFQTNESHTAVMLAGGWPQGSVLGAIRYICAADAIIHTEMRAECFPYHLVDPKDGSEVKYLMRNFMDDSTSLSAEPDFESLPFPHIQSGMQASAIAGSFLSIANNPTKTVVLSTKDDMMPDGIELIQLSGDRLTSEKVEIRLAEGGKTGDLGWKHNFDPTSVHGKREAGEHAANAKVVQAFQRRATTAGAATEVFKEAITLIVLGTVQNSFRVEIPTHRSVFDRIDMPICKTALRQLRVAPTKDIAGLTAQMGLPRKLGGLGYPSASRTAAKTAGIEMVSVMEGRNKELKTALRVGLHEQQYGPATRLEHWLYKSHVQIHWGLPAVKEKYSTRADQDGACFDIMAKADITEADLINAAACTLEFPSLLFRLCRQEEVGLADDGGSIESLRLAAKNTDANCSVEDTILYGSSTVKSQWMSTTRSMNAVLQLCATHKKNGHKNKMVVAVLDERKCQVAYDLTTVNGRAEAGLKTGCYADHLAAKYREVLLADSVIEGDSDAILDYFDISSVATDCNFEQMDTDAKQKCLYQLTTKDINAVAERLKISKDQLRQESDSKKWNANHNNGILLVSDASVLQAKDCDQNQSAADSCARGHGQPRDVCSYYSDYSLLTKRKTDVARLKEALSTRTKGAATTLIYKYWDYDTATADSASDLESGWYLTAVCRSSSRSTGCKLKLMDVTLKAYSNLAEDESMIFANTESVEFSGGSTPTLYAHKIKGQPHDIAASPRKETMIWAPAFALGTTGKVWDADCRNTEDIVLESNTAQVLPAPPPVRKVIETSFKDMHDTFSNEHCSTWTRFANMSPIKELLGDKTMGLCCISHKKESAFIPKPATVTSDYTFEDCIRYGLIPRVSPQAWAFANAWNEWALAMHAGDARGPLNQRAVCHCVTHTKRKQNASTCSLSVDSTAREEQRRQAMAAAAARQMDTEEDDDDGTASETFTCTCGARYNSATELDMHRFTTRARGQKHQRCASEIPAAGGAYVIIDMKTMTPIAAEMVDCATVGCDTSSSTQAETLTALHGMRRLNSMNLKDKNVTCHCDNAALEQRTLLLQDDYKSRRNLAKMSGLPTSKAYSSANTAVQNQAKAFNHTWRGAEHNLASLADRTVADMANFFADHYAGGAAAISAAGRKLYADVHRPPQLDEQELEIHVNSSACSQPIGLIMEEAFNMQTLAEAANPPPNNDERQNAQRHQHCADALHGKIDFETFELTMKKSSTSALDAIDRHTLDCTRLTDAQVIAEMPAQAKPATKKILKHLRAVDTKGAKAGERCILCQETYGEGRTGARRARHYAYACPHFQDEREWLRMKTKDILYSAGRCFAQNNENWVGFFNKTAKQYKPLVRKHSEELKRDKHGRVLIGTTDDATAKHLLNIDTVHTHWANAQTNTGVYIASHPGNIPFWRAKVGHTSRGRETLEKVPRTQFWKNTISLMQETLRQKLSLQSEQPHPAILQWIAARFDLEQQCDTTAFNCTYGIFPATPRLTASMTLPTSIDMDMVGVLPAVELKGTYAQSSFVSVRTSSKDWKQRLEQLKRSCTKNKSLNFVCMLTLDGRDREYACQKMANATGGGCVLALPRTQPERC